jgi:hypothetical protein
VLNLVLDKGKSTNLVEYDLYYIAGQAFMISVLSLDNDVLEINDNY